jgi:hypothetical protein
MRQEADMEGIVAALLKRYRAGGFSRRDLIRGISLMAAGATAGTAAAEQNTAPRDAQAAGRTAAAGAKGRKPTTDDYVALRQVAERYVDAVNRMDADAWGQTFAPDGEWHLSSTSVHKGRDRVVSAWSGIMKGIPNVYMHVYSGVVDEVNGDTASGRWYMGEYLNLANGTRTMNQICYFDTYVRLDGQWYIKTRKYSALYRGKGDFSGEFFKLTGA